MMKRIALMGTGCVGKTSLIQQFIQNKINEDYDPTIQDHYYTKLNIVNNIVSLQIIDTAGHLPLIENDPILYSNIDGYILVYDVSRLKSFVEISDFYHLILQNNNKSNITLCGNKTDLPRQVSYREGRELACKLGCDYLETSAKEAYQVEKIWHDIIQKCLFPQSSAPSKNKSFMCKIL